MRRRRGRVRVAVRVVREYGQGRVELEAVLDEDRRVKEALREALAALEEKVEEVTGGIGGSDEGR
jgi:hypothetical protein